MTIGEIKVIREKQQMFFSRGITRDINFRKEALRKLRKVIIEKEDKIAAALKSDLNKSSFEGYATETGLVLNEIGYFLKKTASLSRKKRVSTPVFAWPSSSYVVMEPLGQVFIISPWNYPFNLALVPLVGAVAAGNVVLLRPSGRSPATNAVIREIIKDSFNEEHVAVADCDSLTSEKALALKWDLIFFTGSTDVGKKVCQMAAGNLTPLVLELGGKCPAMVEDDASVKIAAKRIVWGKLINAGQTCIAPDYLLVNKRVKNELITEMQTAVKNFYGENPAENPDYPRIVSEKAFERLLSYIDSENVISGGRYRREALSLEPTLLNATFSDRCMQDEMFGPILPVIEYGELEEAIGLITKTEKPLAVYFFSNSREKQKRILRETSSGACLFNDVIMHIANDNLPFGGVGASGSGRYHGYESFRTFSNIKAVMNSSPYIDIPIKYPPFGRWEKIIRMILR